jgi:PAS domain S-box-containing protein
MAELLARRDWSATPLGPREAWPLELRTMVDVVLASRFPMVFWWGASLIQIYNDAYLPIIRDKHPAAFGQTARACWREIWDAIGPQITSIANGGPATWNEDVLLDINRHGFVGESYFTWSYSPMPLADAANGVGGVLCTVQETTAKVIGERRILLLRDLAAHGAEAMSAEDECRVAAATLGRYAKSVPFSLIYLIDETRRTARLAACSNVETGDEQAAPASIDLATSHGPWPLGEAHARNALMHVEGLATRLQRVPAGPWPEAAREAVVVPIGSGVANEPAGFLVAAVNPRERFDESYRTFYELIAGQIASALASARAYENERRRAEALAELDRTKIEFFSNVSHEFRTPLTLMVGPLAQLLRDADATTAPLLEAAHRNSLRLLKLVNTLLEFSRLEAGRSEATFVETDLASVTQELGALFESAIEGAGLRFVVETSLAQPAFVDRSMWEMIVLNLLSNALKFTHEGEIRLTLRAAGEVAELIVSDTGVGIPAADLPHVFERFRRVRGAKSRSHEGTGIGLALVDELARLHGGTVDVRSEVGTGSAFTVRVPLGRDHLDPEKVVATTHPTSFGSVVEQYLADVDSTIVRADAEPVRAETGGAKSRVLLADDNGDLRAYVARILAPHHDVVAVRNGAEALDALRRQPFDLVVSDVMMPEMDGFDLVREIRSDAQLKTIPFIMLSARAGETAAIDGLTLGADDYLVKPFSADELIARVYAQLNAAAIRERATQDRRENEERFRTLAASMPHIVLECDLEHGVTFLSEAYRAYTGLAPESGEDRGWLGAVHPADRARTIDAWERALRSGEAFASEFRLRRADGAFRWHAGGALPQHDTSGGLVRWTGTITDIHEMRRSVQERAFLADAGQILSRSLDLTTTLASLASITVPDFADWCQVDLVEGDGSIRTVAVAHRDPVVQALAQRFVGRVHLNPQADRGSPYTIRTGRSDLLEDPGAAAPDVVPDGDELALYRSMGIASAVTIPLVADGTTLGAITAVYGDPARCYTADDLPMLEELGRRAGLAVQRAHEFEREHRVAQSFQAASLPLALPTLHFATFDAVYVPANDEAQVGGDWYDAERLVDGRVIVSIGDVAGNGLRAAVTMGTMRQIIRGIAQVHADPALMLDAADRALRLERPDQFVTAFVGVYDPVGGTFAYASAGHPPPMLRHADGSIELLSDGGLPLGLRQLSKGGGSEVAVEPGASFVFYTDGLTEVSRSPADGEDRVRALLGDGRLLSAAHPAQALRNAVFGDGEAKDDVAILVVGINESDHDAAGRTVIERWVFDSADARAAQAARHAFTDGFRRRSATSGSIHEAEAVFGELVGNAVRYAPGRVEVAVDWSGSVPVLHVLDDGPGYRHVPALPRDVYSESGRGLFMISSLSDDFSVSRRLGGGSHARAVLALRRRRR